MKRNNIYNYIIYDVYFNPLIFVSPYMNYVVYRVNKYDNNIRSYFSYRTCNSTYLDNIICTSMS